MHLKTMLSRQPHDASRTDPKLSPNGLGGQTTRVSREQFGDLRLPKPAFRVLNLVCRSGLVFARMLLDPQKEPFQFLEGFFGVLRPGKPSKCLS